MRIKVSDIDGIHASTPRAGQQLYSLIEPVLATGERVILDFEGVKYFAPGFFNQAIGRVVQDAGTFHLFDLIEFENLPPLGRSSLDSVLDYGKIHRENPRWGAALDQAIRRRAAEAWE